MSQRPKFDSLHSGAWPYDPHVGVGVRLDGLPNDKDGFVQFLMDFSCHPKASERIYSRISAVGHDMLTVMSLLPFDEIADGLKKFGVRMSIIPPMEGWKHKYEDGPYPEDFVPPHMRKKPKQKA
jgi:hypothetical protein